MSVGAIDEHVNRLAVIKTDRIKLPAVLTLRQRGQRGREISVGEFTWDQSKRMRDGYSEEEHTCSSERGTRSFRYSAVIEHARARARTRFECKPVRLFRPSVRACLCMCSGARQEFYYRGEGMGLIKALHANLVSTCRSEEGCWRNGVSSYFTFTI